MTQRNIIKRAAVHLANLSTRLKSTTFFVKYTFESGSDLREAREFFVITLPRLLQYDFTKLDLDMTDTCRIP